MPSTVVYRFTTQTNTRWTNPGNAVDGVAGTFATRAAAPTTGIQTGNPITGTNHNGAGAQLSSITTVELGIQGLTSNTGRAQPVLAAIFNGTTAGPNHNITWTTADTTVYVDITADAGGPGAGNWTWTNITNLDTRVLINRIGGLAVTLSLDQFFVRITYNDAPAMAPGTQPSTSAAVYGALAQLEFDRNMTPGGSPNFAEGTYGASITHEVFYMPAGNAVFAGAADTSYIPIFEYLTSNGAVFAGVADTTFAPTFEYNTSGAMIFSGSGSYLGTLEMIYNVSGSAVFAGAADTSYIPIFEYLTSNGAVFAGSLTAQLDFSYTSSSAAILSGDANYAHGSDYVYISSGLLTGQGSADSSYFPIYLYISTAGTTTNGSADRQVDVIYSAIVAPIIMTGSEHNYSIEYFYEAQSGAIFNGSADYLFTQDYLYEASSNTILAGTSEVQLDFSYEAFGGAILAGIADHSIEYVYLLTGSILISGAVISVGPRLIVYVSRGHMSFIETDTETKFNAFAFVDGGASGYSASIAIDPLISNAPIIGSTSDATQPYTNTWAL